MTQHSLKARRLLDVNRGHDDLICKNKTPCKPILYNTNDDDPTTGCEHSNASNLPLAHADNGRIPQPLGFLLDLE